MTSSLSWKRSYQLSYAPVNARDYSLALSWLAPDVRSKTRRWDERAAPAGKR
jgi:hypothetical protein